MTTRIERIVLLDFIHRQNPTEIIYDNSYTLERLNIVRQTDLWSQSQTGRQTNAFTRNASNNTRTVNCLKKAAFKWQILSWTIEKLWEQSISKIFHKYCQTVSIPLLQFLNFFYVKT
jgi:hypothetical protein